MKSTVQTVFGHLSIILCFIVIVQTRMELNSTLHDISMEVEGMEQGAHGGLYLCHSVGSSSMYSWMCVCLIVHVHLHVYISVSKCLQVCACVRVICVFTITTPPPPSSSPSSSTFRTFIPRLRSHSTYYDKGVIISFKKVTKYSWYLSVVLVSCDLASHQIKIHLSTSSWFSHWAFFLPPLLSPPFHQTS